MLRRARLLRDLRERVFAARGGSDAPARIGAEVEMIPLAADSGAPIPIQTATGRALLPLLRRHARATGWVEEPTRYGVPRFRPPGGGWISFEPGGQLEFSTPPLTSASALLDTLRRVLLPLTAALREEGVELHSVGIDPVNSLEDVPLQLGGARYTRMATYFARRGTAGGRMMRQTAAFQLNLDFGREPVLRWRVLNAAAPYLLAIFANSPVYAGRPTGHASFRAACWRALDPLRTGLLPCTGDAVQEYLGFALAAPAMLLGPPDGAEPPPFGEWRVHGTVTPHDWREHLSTLFPEVRPKGYLELRSLDAVAPEWWAAPVALVGGMLYHPPSLRAAAELLGPPDAGTLWRAGEAGLGDPHVARVARDLFEIGVAGAARLGDGFLAPEDRAVAAEYFDRFTRRARAPADDVLDRYRPAAAGAAESC